MGACRGASMDMGARFEVTETIAFGVSLHPNTAWNCQKRTQGPRTAASMSPAAVWLAPENWVRF